MNLGIKDQIQAMKWVQSHIAAFGGDPKKVSVFGEDAAAISIAIHYLNRNLGKYARAAVGASFSLYPSMNIK